MTLPITKAADRDRMISVKGVIVGKSGIGKTSLLYTLPADETLFIDLEAGGLSVSEWTGDSMKFKTWEDLRDIACYIGGANPARSGMTYGVEHYNYCVEKFGDAKQLEKYKTVFIDSITEAARICFNWSKKQPEAFNERGKPNPLGAYGLHGQEMVTWFKQLQHTIAKNIWLVGILEEKKDDFGRVYFAPQMEGNKAASELIGIVDFFITMAELKDESDRPYRAFVCSAMNPYNFPAKERGGGLIDMLEEPNLTKLMNKIKTKATKKETNDE